MRFIKLGLLSVLGLMLTTPTWALSIEQRVERLERIADNPVLLQQSQKLNSQQREIQSLQDVIEKLERKIVQLENQQEIRNQDTDKRINALIEAQQEIPAEKEKELVVEADKEPEVGDYKERYDAAFSLLRDSKYDESIEAFKSFVVDFADETLASNGYYWLGEAYLIKQEFQSAYDSFEFVLENHGDSNKVPDSMLRGADSLVGLNRLDDAKNMYQDLIKRFPKSSASKSAERRLEKL